MKVLPKNGSSPLTRGKPRPRERNPLPHRLIPAHAGKTAWGGARSGAARAHPRSRGENMSAAIGVQQSAGSSPLTRGKPRAASVRRLRLGLIPAHAGKTAGVRSARAARWAHPRSRGENMMCAIVGFPVEGSSPLTRGKRLKALLHAADRGLIPAHAGKTHGRSQGHLHVGAHPRSRGENAASERRARAWKGSSPLTRGKPLPRRPGARGLGLIPAHAGKTLRTTRDREHAEAHPRSRGENAPRSVPNS